MMEDFVVDKPLFEYNTRRYLVLSGKRVKVPWRYNRVMCAVQSGSTKTVQELVTGDCVQAQLEFATVWKLVKIYIP